MTTTYHAFLVDLAKSEDIKSKWARSIKHEDRKSAAETIRKYMQSYWKMMITFPIRFVPDEPGILTRDQQIKLTNFFFFPEKTIFIYKYE